MVVNYREFIIYTSKKLTLPDISNSLNNNNVIEKGANIYPVPVGDIPNVNTTINTERLSIFDLKGRLVREFTINNERPLINLIGMDPGLYLLRINYSGGGIEYLKFMKN